MKTYKIKVVREIREMTVVGMEAETLEEAKKKTIIEVMTSPFLVWEHDGISWTAEEAT